MKRVSVVLSVAAAAFGSVLIMQPASAQNYGRNPNDGGLVQVQGDYYPPQTSTAPSAPPHYGRPANDGGLVDVQPSGPALYNSARTRTAKQVKTPATPPHYGRPLNDGGF